MLIWRGEKMITISKGIITWSWTENGRPKRWLNLKRFFTSLAILALCIMALYAGKKYFAWLDIRDQILMDRVAYEQTKSPLVWQD